MINYGTDSDRIWIASSILVLRFWGVASKMSPCRKTYKLLCTKSIAWCVQSTCLLFPTSSNSILVKKKKQWLYRERCPFCILMKTWLLKWSSSDILTDVTLLSLRVGDDEQSDWFFEGDCGVGTGLLPGWDSDNPLSLKGNHPLPAFLHPTRPPQRGIGWWLCSRLHTTIILRRPFACVTLLSWLFFWS